MATAYMKPLIALALASPWHPADAARSPIVNTAGALSSDDGSGYRVTVRLLVTRHAFSCANAVNEFGSDLYQKKKHIFMEDPLLTDCGAHRSKLAAEGLRESPDLVITSSLLRAMETAAFMYPNATIVPVPYISENGFGADNTPKLLEAQLDTLRTAVVSKRSALSIDRLDLQWMRNHPPFSDTARSTPNWSYFKKFMAENLLPTLPAELRKRELTIAMVTHSNFMRAIPELMSECRSYFKDKPKNNQVLELRYSFTSGLVLSSDAGGRTGSPRFEALDPYTVDAADAWQQVAGALGREENVETLFANLVRVKPPPWDAAVSSIQFEREFAFDETGGCKDLVPVSTSNTQLCEADFGAVCRAEIDALAYFRQPLVYSVEQNRTAAEKDLALAERSANQERIAKARSKLDELRSFACCVS